MTSTRDNAADIRLVASSIRILPTDLAVMAHACVGSPHIGMTGWVSSLTPLMRIPRLTAIVSLFDSIDSVAEIGLNSHAWAPIDTGATIG